MLRWVLLCLAMIGCNGNVPDMPEDVDLSKPIVGVVPVFRSQDPDDSKKACVVYRYCVGRPRGNLLFCSDCSAWKCADTTSRKKQTVQFRNCVSGVSKL